MKVIDRIAKISYWTTIIFIFFVFILMPIIFINIPDSFEKFNDNKGMNPYYLTLSIISFAVIFLWGYCLWFWYKKDKYSKSIFLLLFFNWLYAPVYYYRVKIKKRPLRNKIKIQEHEQKEDKGISDREFIDLTRENIISVLQLWTSKEEQLEYQESVPIAQVSAELFGQWEDFYTPDSEVIKEAFPPIELRLLEDFEKELTNRANEPNTFLPVIEEYIETDDWKALNTLAKKILNELKK